MCYHVVTDAVIGQRVEHAAESRRPGRRADQILQDQIPADEKRHKLADRHVAVGVRRARGFRDPDPELCVANSFKENTETWQQIHSSSDKNIQTLLMKDSN